MDGRALSSEETRAAVTGGLKGDIRTPQAQISRGAECRPRLGACFCDVFRQKATVYL